MPRTIARKYRVGFMRLASCNQTGIFCTDVAKPEVETAGTTNKNAPKIACCCVFTNDEINNPTPITASR